MKKFTILSICFLVSLKLIAQQFNLVDFSQNISAENIKNDVYELASKKMQGRETAKEGQKLAAVYIYKQFKKAGLIGYQMQSDSLSYFQNFSIYSKTVPDLNLSVNGKKLNPYDDFALFGYKSYKADGLDLIYLGTAPDSSYINKDLSNKAVCFLTSNLFAGPVKALDIINKTNCNIVFYSNPLNPHQIQTVMQRQKRMFSKRQILHPQKFPLSIPFDSLTQPERYKKYNRMLSTYQGPISAKSLTKILKVKVKDLKKCINDNPLKIKNDGNLKIDVELKNEYNSQSTENVIACLPGTDKKEEYIILSAHYDHVGMNGQKIYYGANDNASGTAALLEIARKLKKAVDAGLKLKRSIVFAAFTGEEKGLLGSKYFVENKTFPHDNIKTNLNIDMLGRKDNRHDDLNFVYLLGTNDLNPKLKTITDSINNQYPKLELDYSYDTADSFLYSASDQASFVKRNIPAIFYFNGLHNDYHKTTDTPDKIDYDAIKKVSSLIFLTAIELANQ
ncbi:M28 family metallopeptidase [Marinifilum flexuosum]|uniref:Peptidase M28-like protein n=1 Tax=Marinifilum flexuosum TaxID=1117708 RepID=A0A419XBE2_9BACT|nr:M28 family peptidase [Marinifilum flexuosum]RKE04889.1 peptidase M28-like protein [Marinifilum flexuosum]